MTNEEFGLVVERYERLVYTICYQLVRDHQEAQNLAQETFLSAYTHLERCREDEIKPWLARIAANKAKDYLKSAYHRKVAPDQDTLESRAGAPAPESAPDEIYVAREGERAIRDKIYSLKEPYLQVSVLYFIHGRSVEEIALALGRPKKTVQTQIYRARNTLRQQIEEGGGP